jgi:hypothetical protein
MKQTPIAVKKFKSEVVLERSITPAVESLGTLFNVMELHSTRDPDKFFIIWECYNREGEHVTGAEIGIWTEPSAHHVVVDYDGVFSLPVQAKELLKEAHFDITQVDVI